MIYLDFFQLIIVIATCGISCFSDLKIGKIKNKILFTSTIISLIIIAIKIFAYQGVNLLAWGENLSVIVAFSFLLYATHIWAGGDSKLSIFIAISFPTNMYFIYNDKQFTLWIFLVVAFSLGIVYLFFESILNLIKNSKNFDRKKFFVTLKELSRRYIKSLIYLTFLNQIYMYFVQPHINVNGIVYFSFSLVFIYFVSKVKFLDTPTFVISFLIFDVLMMIITKNIAIVTYWQTYLLVLFFIVVRSFVFNYNYQRVNTEDVSKGMVLSRFDTLLFQKSKVKGLPDLSDETLKSRITEEEANSIKRWGKSKYGNPQVNIVRKIPFGVFVFVGVIAYSLLGVLQYCNLL